MKLLAAASTKCLRSRRRSCRCEGTRLGLHSSQSQQCPVLIGTETVYLHVLYHTKSRVQAGTAELEVVEVPAIFQHHEYQFTKFIVQVLYPNICLWKKSRNVPMRSHESIKTPHGTPVELRRLKPSSIGLEACQRWNDIQNAYNYSVPHAFNASYF